VTLCALVECPFGNPDVRQSLPGDAAALLALSAVRVLEPLKRLLWPGSAEVALGAWQTDERGGRSLFIQLGTKVGAGARSPVSAHEWGPEGHALLTPSGPAFAATVSNQTFQHAQNNGGDNTSKALSQAAA
jgi:hypothetical protein